MHRNSDFLEIFDTIFLPPLWYQEFLLRYHLQYFLEAAFVKGIKQQIPEPSAKAQVLFDCWVEETEKPSKGRNVEMYWRFNEMREAKIVLKKHPFVHSVALRAIGQKKGVVVDTHGLNITFDEPKVKEALSSAGYMLRNAKLEESGDDIIKKQGENDVFIDYEMFGGITVTAPHRHAKKVIRLLFGSRPVPASRQLPAAR